MISVTVKLYASLAAHLPAEARSTNAHRVQVDVDASVAQTLAPYSLPPELTKLVLVNGHYIAPEERASHRLKDGDVIAVWPPIAGG